MPAIVVRGDGIDIAVRVTPRGGRDRLGPGTQDHLVARLAAAPVDGAANAALVALVADRLGTTRRAVTILSGQTARLKRLRVAGDPAVLAQRVASLYEAAS